MQLDFDATDANVQKVKTGVRTMSGNNVISDVALLMPSVRFSVTRACD